MKSVGASKRTSYRVIYGDTDKMGVVYYANYLRWFELGRSEFLREVGYPYRLIEERGTYFPVVEASCRYFKSAHYDDLIVVQTALTMIARASLVFAYGIHLGSDDSLVASGSTKHACVDKDGRIRRIDGDLIESLRAELSFARDE
jgi:acyl-CoA thioester hydrolase